MVWVMPGVNLAISTMKAMIEAGSLPNTWIVCLKEINERIHALLAAGWKSVRVVTDHGWLLFPGGLPKIELPSSLTDNKWGRCACLKQGASTDQSLYSWFWNPHHHFVLADGVSCFKNGEEYTHGGLEFTGMFDA